MRIAINGWFWDQPRIGSGQYIRQLLAHLLQIAPAHAYILVTPEGSQEVTSQEVTSQRVTSYSSPVTHHPLLVTRKLGFRKVWFEQVTFPRACRRLGVDLAHVPYWGSPFSPTVPTLVTIHDLIPLLLPAYQGNALVRTYTGLVQSAAASAALTLTDSRASKRDIVTHLGLPDERVRVVYLAADRAFSPEPVPDDAAIRAQYSLPDEYVLYLGGFDVRKNLVGLLQAWTFAEGPVGQVMPLVIAGHLPEHSDFTPDPRRVAQALEIAPQTLLFPGPIAEAHKPAVYRGAVCFLYPSRYEGFGLTPLEALSCGVPVIGSDASSLPEVVGDAGVLVPPDDTRGMAGALIAVATEPATRDRLSARALAQAARFSWEETAWQTLAAYEEVSS
jgi:glycosyltransferase involved in cell wall biosynthesis